MIFTHKTLREADRPVVKVGTAASRHRGTAEEYRGVAAWAASGATGALVCPRMPVVVLVWELMQRDGRRHHIGSAARRRPASRDVRLIRWSGALARTACADRLPGVSVLWSTVFVPPVRGCALAWPLWAARRERMPASPIVSARGRALPDGRPTPTASRSIDVALACNCKENRELPPVSAPTCPLGRRYSSQPCRIRP